jgi:uncharacterized protein YndB with AHSA1/START domain
MATESGNKLSVKVLSDTEVVLTRRFNAPRELVFQAHADPGAIPQWWGLRSSETVVNKMEFRPGGAWRYLERSPDDEEHGFRGEFLEIAPPERIVATFEWEGLPGHVIRITTTFAETDGVTTLTAHSLFASIEDRDGMLNSGMESGSAEMYDQLAEYLETLK